MTNFVVVVGQNLVPNRAGRHLKSLLGPVGSVLTQYQPVASRGELWEAVWLLVSEPGKIGLAGIFDIFWSGTKSFKKSGPETCRSRRDLHFPGLISQNHMQKSSKTRPADQNLTFQTPGHFSAYIFLFLPATLPPKSRSRPEVSISGPDSSKYSVPYQKVSKIQPTPNFARFTNKKPVCV